MTNSRPAAPESPEIDALIECHRTEIPARSPLIQVTELIEHARSLERRLSLAQTEIKGHMKMEDELKAELAEYQAKHTAIMREADRRYDELIAHDQDNLAELDKAQSRIAELEKELETLRGKHGSA